MQEGADVLKTEGIPATQHKKKKQRAKLRPRCFLTRNTLDLTFSASPKPLLGQFCWNRHQHQFFQNRDSGKARFDLLNLPLEIMWKLTSPSRHTLSKFRARLGHLRICVLQLEKGQVHDNLLVNL